MPENKLPTIQWVSIGKLTPASWNPPGRTSDKSLRSLVSSMREDGFWEWEPIQVVKEEGQWIVADGNRRFRVAQIIGLEEVPVVFVKMDSMQYWAKKNGTIKPPTIRETGIAISRGLNYIPPNHERTLNDLLSVYEGDWDKIRELFEQGASPSIVTAARRVANYVGFKGDNEFIARTIAWMTKHRMSLTVSRAIYDKIDAEALYAKIASDEPLRNLYG